MASGFRCCYQVAEFDVVRIGNAVVRASIPTWTWRLRSVSNCLRFSQYLCPKCRFTSVHGQTCEHVMTELWWPGNGHEVGSKMQTRTDSSVEARDSCVEAVHVGPGVSCNAASTYDSFRIRDLVRVQDSVACSLVFQFDPYPHTFSNSVSGSLYLPFSPTNCKSWRSGGVNHRL